MKRSKLMPPAYFLFCAGLTVLVAMVVPSGGRVSFPYNLSGILFISLGVTLNIWADGLFKRIGTTVKPFVPATAFAQTGPYRLTRNPMYLGFLIILMGIALLLKSYPALLGALTFFLLMNILFIRHEEADLIHTFGSTYLAYKRRVRRWL
jgi:protein-S-isoprenylcysteine O-methyltransferase Ste14